MKMQILLVSKYTNVVIFSNDKKILVLTIRAFSKFNVTKIWYSKYDHDKFINIAKVIAYLGHTISLALPKLHALIGSDPTSYFF